MDDSYWDEVRSEFILDSDYVHLALSMLTAHPRPVREAVAQHREGLDRNPALYFKLRDGLNKRARESAARYLAAEPDSIALTESTTMGLAVVYTGLALRPGEEILSTEHEHYAASELLRFKCESSGAVQRSIRLYDDPRTATEEEIVSAVVDGIRDETRVLALTWVHSGTGVKLPLDRIAEAVRRADANRPDDKKIIICVDAVHGFGVEDFEVSRLGCDFFVAGCHKWLFGPRGTGLVWGSERGWEAVRPIMTSFEVEVFWPWYEGFQPDEQSPPALLCTPGGFPAYEHRWALSEAFDFHLSLGKRKVADRIAELNRHAKMLLAELDGIRVRTPTSPDLSSGMICLDVRGIDPAKVVDLLLDKRVIVGQTPYRDSAVRLAPGIVNTLADIDQAVAALNDIIP